MWKCGKLSLHEIKEECAKLVGKYIKLFMFLICCECLIPPLSYSLWDGVLSSLDLAEELLRYAVIKGELAIQHGEQHHAKSPHVTGFTAVRPTWRQEGEEDQDQCLIATNVA